MSEIVGFLKAGEIRALAVLTDERVSGFEDIPTAKEQSFGVLGYVLRKLDIPTVPVILGILLGGNMEDAYAEQWLFLKVISPIYFLHPSQLAYG